MKNLKIQLTPIAITATSQQYLVDVVANLCQGYCATGTVQPIGGVTFNVANQQTVGTQTVVTINASLNVLYTPKGACRAIPKQASGEFKVAFIGAQGAVPTIALTPLQTEISPYNIQDKCSCNIAYGVSLATPLTIAATFPA